MFKKSALMIILAAQISCGPDNQQTAKILSFDDMITSKAPESVRPHFAEFLQYCYNSSEEDKRTCAKNLNQFVGFTLQKGPLHNVEPQVIGLCHIRLSAKSVVEREIVLRSDYANHDSLAFKALVWHELGHCLLDLDHVPDSYGDHIMNSALPNEDSLGDSWSSYVEDMFGYKIKSSYLFHLIFD